MHFDFGVPINLIAEVEDNDNAVERVDFILNGLFAASATADPFQVTLTELQPGEYTVTADVIVAGTVAATSTAILIFVDPIDSTDQQTRLIQLTRPILWTGQCHWRMPLGRVGYTRPLHLAPHRWIFWQ
ncbi:MAG: Ig-like domain-containing protein [Verrucomicrobia bacterium]|nr:Ig-like domain-containing protein [Verrucomicrobiota bacterium]